jgi:hypothetical protein
MTSNPVTAGLSSKNAGGTSYVSDTQSGSAEKYNMWVNAGSTFEVDESQASGMKNYNLFVSTVLLNNFATGEGPENYVFPENGIISSMMKNSIIVQNALTEFKASNASSSQAQYSFGLGDLAKNGAAFKTPFNIEGFVGSGTITMVKTETSIKVTVFNVTSLYSGAYTAKTGVVPGVSSPTSNVRNPNASSNTYYGNISQTFSFTAPVTK